MLLLDIEMLCCCFHYPLMRIMQHSSFKEIQCPERPKACAGRS